MSVCFGVSLLTRVTSTHQSRRVSLAWRRLLIFGVSTYRYGKAEGEYNGDGGELERERGLTRRCQLDLVALKLSTRRLACRTFQVIAGNFRKNACMNCFRVWNELVQASNYNENMRREYLHLRDIMNSYGRLQAHVA